MRRFVVGVDRGQTTLFPESLDDWVGEDNPVRVIDAFVDALDLRALGFAGIVPEVTGRPRNILRFCSSSTPTAISTGCSRAAGWSARPVAMSS
jgi:transposase